MFGYWYNSSIRRYCILMGDLFSHVQVARMRDGVIETTKVPITFASKERFAMKLDAVTSVNKEGGAAKVETILPRMCLNLVDIVYNGQYKTNMLNKVTISDKKDQSKRISQYNPVPVKFLFELGIYTRHQDDMFQIIEQIWPYFQPHFNTTMQELFGNDISFERSIRVVLQSFSPDNQVETDMTTRRRLESNFIFEVNGWIYPPVAEIKGEIKTIYVDLFANQKELSAKGNFESVDTQVDPIDSTREDWKGEYIQTMSNGIPIPLSPENPKPRENL